MAPVRWTINEASQHWGVDHGTILGWIYGRGPRGQKSPPRLVTGRDVVLEETPHGKLYVILDDTYPAPSIAPIPYIPKPRQARVPGPSLEQRAQGAGLSEEEIENIDLDAEAPVAVPVKRRLASRVMKPATPAPIIDEVDDEPLPPKTPAQEVDAWAWSVFPEEGPSAIGSRLTPTVAGELGTDRSGISRKGQTLVEAVLLKIASGHSDLYGDQLGLHPGTLSIPAQEDLVRRMVAYLAKYTGLKLANSRFVSLGSMPLGSAAWQHMDVPPDDIEWMSDLEQRSR